MTSQIVIKTCECCKASGAMIPYSRFSSTLDALYSIAKVCDHPRAAHAIHCLAYDLDVHDWDGHSTEGDDATLFVRTESAIAVVDCDFLAIELARPFRDLAMAAGHTGDAAPDEMLESVPDLSKFLHENGRDALELGISRLSFWQVREIAIRQQLGLNLDVAARSELLHSVTRWHPNVGKKPVGEVGQKLSASA